MTFNKVFCTILSCVLVLGACSSGEMESDSADSDEMEMEMESSSADSDEGEMEMESDSADSDEGEMEMESDSADSDKSGLF